MPTAGAAIQIGFTDQKVTGHAGLVPFCGFLHRQRSHALLAGVLPHVRTSPKAIPPADLALGFIVGLLAAQLVRIEGHVWKGAATESTIETVFGLTSRAAASPAALLAAQREHWGAIENGQHHRRDRTYREDDSPVRDPNGTPCYAALRALAIPPPASNSGERRPQDYHLPDFLSWARKLSTTVIRWFTTSYHPP